MTEQTPLPAAGRILALDVGKKRIGLAVTDELRLTAQGMETFARKRVRDDLAQLGALMARMHVTLLLVGKPLHMSGAESRQSEYTREFADRLSGFTNVPVVYWDERMTSLEAERLLREAGSSLAEKKRAVDRLSAVLLLESYLSYLETAAETAGGQLA